MSRLVGVGVGPGDPDLVTVKAVQVLRDADVVFVPVADTGVVGRAERTVLAHVDRPVRRLEFALAEDAREPAWAAAASSVVAALDEAALVAFATIGDPSIYSTFSYLAAAVRALRPDVEVAAVPGVTAMQDLAARTGTVLVEGEESLLLLPLTAGLDRFREALREHDAVVAYKGGRMLAEVLAAIDAAGRLDGAVYGAALGLADEDVRPARALLGAGGGPYLSTVIVPPERS